MPIPDEQPRNDPLPTPPHRDRICQQLRDLIIKGELATGEILRNHTMAEQLEVNRPPVREALHRLEDEALVQTASNLWTG